MSSGIHRRGRSDSGGVCGASAVDVLSSMSLNFDERSSSSSAADDDEESSPPGSGSGAVAGWPEFEHCDGQVNPRGDLGSNSEVVSPALGLGGRSLFGMFRSPGRRHLM